MNLFITNDDGIGADGIRHLVDALSPYGEIYVFAPDSQKSACGHGITVNRPIAVNQVDFPGATLAHTVSGTPADCVKLGLRLLRGQGITVDFVFSGINHGSNLGTDTLYSGTVSGAIEGVINGIPSVALSIYAMKPKDFEPAKTMAAQALRLIQGKLDGGTVLNINLPDASMEEIKGLRVTRLGAREYDEEFTPKNDGNGNTSYVYSGEPVVYSGLSENIDVIAVQDGCISITPLHYDLTSHALVEEVKSWGFAYSPADQ
jgi:5'-nucleotidase